MDRFPRQASMPHDDAPSEPLDAALLALLDLLNKGTIPQNLPHHLEQNVKFQEVLSYLTALQRFALSLANGDLSQTLKVRGPMAGSFKSLQANLRHLTWQAQMIAQGDFSQRVDFMGEFSAAFNTMVASLDEARDRLEQREAELARVNASLVQEIAERKQAEALLRERVLFETLVSDLSAAFVNLPASQVYVALQASRQRPPPQQPASGKYGARKCAVGNSSSWIGWTIYRLRRPANEN